MSRYRLCLLFGLLSVSLSILSATPDPQADRLWHSFEALQDASVEAPAPAEDWSALHRSAAEILAAAEYGDRTISADEQRRLERILAYRPDSLWLAAAPKGARAETTARATGTISGTVTEQGTGTAVVGATVTATPFGGDPFAGASSGVTDSSGNYSFPAEEGLYVLQIKNPTGYISEAWPDLHCVDRNFCSPWYGGDVVEVTPGGTFSASFQLDRGVRVTGTVDDGGGAVQNARVTIESSSGIVRASATTDASGNYTTSTALPPGDYRVFVNTSYNGSVNDTTPAGLIGRLHDGQDCQRSCSSLGTTYLSLTDTTTPTTRNFTLNPGFGLSGTVTEVDGVTPLAGAFVKLIATDGIILPGLQTDSSGHYETGILRPADYHIVVSHPETLSLVHPNVECFSTDCVIEVGTPVALGGSAQVLDYSLSPGATVTGTVVRDSDGAVLENAGVTVGNSIQGYRSTTTDVAGAFSIKGLAEGTHYVRVSPPATHADLQKAHLGNVNCPSNFCSDFGQPLSVPASGSVAAGEIRLEQGGAIGGTMTDGLTGADLTQLFTARLELFVASGPFAGELAAQVFPVFDPGVEVSGNYLAQGLKPGAYKAVFGTSTHLGLVDTSFGGQACPRGSCDLSALPTVFVTAGATTAGISATLPRGPVIGGRVTDAVTGGAPLPPELGDDGNRLVAFYGTSGNYASFSLPDRDGYYQSRTGFPSDTFFASTHSTRNDVPFGGNYVDEAYNDVDCPRLKCNLTASATGLTVAGSDIGNVDFALRQGGRIAGNVIDQTTTDGLGGVGIEVYDTAGSQVAVGQTDALGNYQVSGLPTGSYTVRTRNSRGYVDELYDDGNCAIFCDPVNGTSVSVTEGATTAGIDFGLVESVGISGAVSVAGTPTGNISVEVYGALGNFLAETLSASDGSYEFTGLAPGEFYLRTRNTFDHADVLYNANPCVGDACQVRRGDSVVLAAGSSVTGVGLDLQAGAVVSGTVEDRDTTAGLSGVRVQLLDDRGAVALEETSGASGGFSFTGLAAGTYHLVTRETPGYVDQVFGGTPCPTACNGLNGTPITIAAGATASGNVLDLTQGGEVSGNVTAGGSPAVGAQVQVYNASGVPVSQVPTNASGNYQVDTLPDGDFYVRALGVSGYISELYNDQACSGYCDILSGDAVTLTGGTGGGSTDFALSAGGSIAGNVSSVGSALPGVTVVAYDGAGFVAGAGVTDGSGNYSIGALLNGSYRLRTANVGGFVDEVYGGDSCSPTACLLGSGSTVSVSGGATGGIDFDLAAGSSIAGTATDAFGNPLPDGTAVLFDSNGIEVTATTISEGLWAFDGLADGTYYVLIENTLGLVDELYDGVSCPAGACDITALGTPIVIGGGAPLTAGARGAAGTVNGLNVTLDRGRAVGGTVTDAGSGDPVIGVTVYVFDDAGNLASFGTTDGLGEYVTGGGLPEGTYYAATASGAERGAPGSYVNGLYDGGQCLFDCDPLQGTAFTVGATGASGIDFSLATGTGLRGAVTGPGGQPVVQAEVLVFGADGFLAGRVRTDSQGAYEVDGLPPGDYFAHTANSQGLADETFGGAACGGGCDPADSDPITVGSGGFTESVDFTLGVLDPIFSDRFEQAL